MHPLVFGTNMPHRKQISKDTQDDVTHKPNTALPNGCCCTWAVAASDGRTAALVGGSEGGSAYQQSTAANDPVADIRGGAAQDDLALRVTIQVYARRARET